MWPDPQEVVVVRAIEPDYAFNSISTKLKLPSLS